MQKDASKRLLTEMCQSRICIDSYENGEMQGKVVNPCYSGNLEFKNLISFLKIMEALFDKFEYPQSSMSTRHFAGKKAPAPVTDIEFTENLDKEDYLKTETRGKLATFRIQVRFRQNASWQGTLTWVEGNKTENFRSVLELIMLMDSSFAAGAASVSGEDGSEEAL